MSKIKLPFICFLQNILKSFGMAFVFCLPILLGAFLLSHQCEKIYIFLNSFFVIFSALVFLKAPKKGRFVFGFFIGLLLFYWIGLSFRFSAFPLLGFVVVILIAVIYGSIFALLLWSENVYFRALMFLFLGFIHPFYFDWLEPRAFFAYSIFGVDVISCLCFVLSVACFCDFFKNSKILQFFRLKTFNQKIFGLLFGLLLMFSPTLQTDFRGLYVPNLKIALAQTRVPQDLRWNEENFHLIKEQNFNLIKQAINENKEMIILPETAFPIALNRATLILKDLADLSQKIVIVVGGLRIDERGKIFNSSYLFEKGQIKIIDKVILAPFGEKIPLPDFIARRLQKIFFGTEDEMQSAKNVQNFQIFHLDFRNAICYEGTSSLLYKDNPKYVIMISNNAWFYPSIEPFFQQILLKYYARISKAVIFHSANFSNSMLIVPNLF